MYSPVATNACKSISKLLKQYYFHLHKLTQVNCHLYIMVPIKTNLPTEIISTTSILLRCFACNVTLLFVRSLFYSSSSSSCTPLSISKTCDLLHFGIAASSFSSSATLLRCFVLVFIATRTTSEVAYDSGSRTSANLLCVRILIRLNRRRRQCAGGDRIFATIRSMPIESHPRTARGIKNRARKSRNLPRNHH